jgi:putative isomerase
MLVALSLIAAAAGAAAAQTSIADWQPYAQGIRGYLYGEYQGMFREAEGALKHPFIVPGSAQYPDQLWDWDSWWTNVALRQLLLEAGSPEERANALRFEQGCVLNFLEYGGADGFIPYLITPRSGNRQETIAYFKSINGGIFEGNMHKPCLAQHAAFITQQQGGDAEWLREKFYYLQSFVDAYYHHYRHRPTGLYVYANDKGTGTDNDPTQYYRPRRSTATPFLNALMYKELKAMAYLCERLKLAETAWHYVAWAAELKAAMQKHSWDPLLGYYFSVDVNLLPIEAKADDSRHIGMPRHYDALIMRIMTWTGFCALWAEIATPEQAAVIVERHFRDTANLNAPVGIRTLSPLEKMYYAGASGNPSSWLGPVWIVSNYMTFQGLLHYGFEDEARELAAKTVVLLGQDIRQSGAMHEYYLPSNGQPLLNKGFLNWNCLVLNMLAWLEGKPMVAEF